MEVGDLVKYKTEPASSRNPLVLVVKVWPGTEVSVTILDPSGQPIGRFANQLEVVSENR